MNQAQLGQAYAFCVSGANDSKLQAADGEWTSGRHPQPRQHAPIADPEDERNRTLGTALEWSAREQHYKQTRRQPDHGGYLSMFRPGDVGFDKRTRNALTGRVTQPNLPGRTQT